MVEKRLPPWEEIGYFQVPVVTSVAVGVTGFTPLVSASSNRVAVLFTAPLSGSTVGLAISAAGPALAILTASMPNWDVTEAEFGPLASQAWFASASQLTNVVVTEIVLRQWPEENPL